MKKIIVALVIIGMLAPIIVFAKTTEKVKITGIRVQGKWSWIFFTPDQEELGCDAENSVQVDNDNPNQAIIISLAMSAMLAGKEVVWVYSSKTDSCSNGKKVVGGIKVFD